jgi:hypothetical protein
LMGALPPLVRYGNFPFVTRQARVLHSFVLATPP